MDEVRERNHDVARSALDRVDGRRAQVGREELNARKDLEAERKHWEDDSALQDRLSEAEQRQERERFARRAKDLATHYDERGEALEADEDSAVAQLRVDGILSREFRNTMLRAEQLIAELRRCGSAVIEVDRERTRLRRECITLCWKELEAENAMAARDSIHFTRFLTTLFLEAPEKT
ncbi:hypothetical protein [Myxococcus qinghaiensis]|uniref:hypothetical protein n=1 Tax=Myxococcus qinghaiensis TaxID=2906758 RepID=UPI0020A7A40B|nr:hypothetical protein [Myxococcus qinghaiensis]MCP3161513.1 hypothetical protein [Myxococcus qinghaiensis]